MSTAIPGSECVGRIIDGRFRLLRWLGGTEHSSVFLTEPAGDAAGKSAIKLVAAGEDCSAQWEAARTLRHPHLIRLLEFGRTELDGKQQQYAVMEYAEEVLSEILAERPLTAAETAEMLPAILDALATLHGRGLVHGGLKPSNILAAGDSLKLAVDTVQPAGQQGRQLSAATDYDAPERSTEKLSPAMDVWSLGMVLVKTLTQDTPAWNPASVADPVVPASVPEPFASIARDCLRMDPARRCTVAEIKTRLMPETQAAPVAEPVPAAVARPAPAAVRERAPARAPMPPAAPPSSSAGKGQSKIPAVVTLVIALLGASYIAVLDIRSCVRQERPAVTQNSVPPAANATPQTQPEAAAGGGVVVKGAVAHQVLPDAPQAAMDTIHGHFAAEIRVEVGGDGHVSDAAIEQQGPSRYFADFALKAAREWKFKPAERDGRAAASTWLLHFVFAQSGVEATAEELQP